MTKFNKRNLKKLTYIGLSLSALGFLNDCQAKQNDTEDNYDNIVFIKFPKNQKPSAKDLEEYERKKSEVSEETIHLITADVGDLKTFFSTEKIGFTVKRIYEQFKNKNVLDIRNNNSHPLTITFQDEQFKPIPILQVKKDVTIGKNQTMRFVFNRYKLPSSYSIKGEYVGSCDIHHSKTCENLNSKKFYSKIVFESDKVGTTPELKKTGDVY